MCKAAGKAGELQKYIHTVKGYGYLFKGEK